MDHQILLVINDKILLTIYNLVNGKDSLIRTELGEKKEEGEKALIQTLRSGGEHFYIKLDSSLFFQVQTSVTFFRKTSHNC